jgi:predicted PurR-regulated permease PerM
VSFVLSVLLFYALDPAVDALQRWRVPRAIGAALMLGVVLTGVAAVTLSLSDDVAEVVAELPDGARRLGAARTSDHMAVSATSGWGLGTAEGPLPVSDEH